MRRQSSGEPPPDRIVHALEQAAEALVLAWTRGIEDAGVEISPPQLRALLVLERHGVMSVGGLGEALGAIPSSVSRLCDRLQASGLVSRQVGEADRREIAIRLTQAGRGFLDRLHRVREEHLADVLGRMSPTSRNALLAGLHEFDRALGAAGRASEPP